MIFCKKQLISADQSTNPIIVIVQAVKKRFRTKWDNMSYFNLDLLPGAAGLA